MQDYTTDDRTFRVAYQAERRFQLSRYLRMGWYLLRRAPVAYLQATLLAIGGYLTAAALATLAIWATAPIPFLNAVVILVAYFLRYAFAFALAAGLLVLSRRLHLTRSAEWGDVWTGLSAFWSIGAAKVIQLLLMSVPMLVVLLLAGIRSYDELVIWAEQDLITPVEILRFYQRELRLLALALLPYLLVQSLYLFTTPLILLGRLRFWTAMEVSRKIVLRHWRGVLQLTLFIGLLWVGSLLTLGLGLLLAFPLTYTSVYAAYADLTEERARFWGEA